MKISVVIPVYNEEKYIKNCLDSLMKQEEKPDEIIVVDGKSKDKTKLIIKSFKNKINLRFLEIEKPNGRTGLAKI